jgi:hypothetical protein
MIELLHRQPSLTPPFYRPAGEWQVKSRKWEGACGAGAGNAWRAQKAGQGEGGIYRLRGEAVNLLH